MIKYDLKINKGIAKNHFFDKRASDGSHYSIDIFYKLIDDKLLINYELMITDTNPIEPKILNYYNVISLINSQVIEEEKIEKLIRTVKFDAFLIKDMKNEFQKLLRKNINDFKYEDLYRDIYYVNLLKMGDEILEIILDSETSMTSCSIF